MLPRVPPETPRQVVEVEAEPIPEAPEHNGRSGSSARSGSKGRAAGEAPLHPLWAGVVIDLLDFAMRGPRGMLLGLPLGLCVGYYVGRRMGLDRGRSLGLGALCAIYCALPGTELIPLATLIGAYRAFSARARAGHRRARARAAAERARAP